MATVSTPIPQATGHGTTHEATKGAHHGAHHGAQHGTQEVLGLALGNVPGEKTAPVVQKPPEGTTNPVKAKKSITEYFKPNIKIIYVSKGNNSRPCVGAKIRLDEGHSAINKISKAFLHHLEIPHPSSHQTIEITWSPIENDAGLPAMVQCHLEEMNDFHLILKRAEYDRKLGRRRTWLPFGGRATIDDRSTRNNVAAQRLESQRAEFMSRNRMETAKQNIEDLGHIPELTASPETQYQPFSASAPVSPVPPSESAFTVIDPTSPGPSFSTTDTLIDGPTGGSQVSSPNIEQRQIQDQAKNIPAKEAPKVSRRQTIKDVFSKTLGLSSTSQPSAPENPQPVQPPAPQVLPKEPEQPVVPTGTHHGPVTA